jgi:hypothetical protein
VATVDSSFYHDSIASALVRLLQVAVCHCIEIVEPIHTTTTSQPVHVSISEMMSACQYQLDVLWIPSL